MVKKFRGQVKISDVQSEFDAIVNRINNMVDAYNESEGVKDIDYTVGGDTLAPAGYTLTIGGLKQVMNTMDGLVCGAKPIRLSADKVRLTDGILITKNGFFRLPQTEITPIQGKTIFYNTLTNQYQWNGQGNNEILVPVQKGVNKDIHYAGMASEELGGYKGYKMGYDTYTAIKAGSSILNATKLYNTAPTSLLFYKSVSIKDSSSLNLDVSKYPHIAGIIDNKSKIRIPVSNYSVNPSDGFTIGQLNTNLNVFKPFLDITYTIGTGNNGYSHHITVNGNSVSVSSVPDSPELVKVEMSPVDYSYSSQVPIYPSFYEFTFGIDELSGKNVMIVSVLDKDNEEITKVNVDLPQNINNYAANCILFRKYGYDNAVFTESGNTPSDVPIEDSRFIWNAENYVLYNDNIKTGTLAEQNTITVYEKQTVASDEAAYRICDINMLRDSVFCSDLAHAQVEGISGTFKITSQTKWRKPVAEKPTSNPDGETVNTSKAPKFVSGLEEFQLEGEGTATLKLLGTTVAWNRQTGHRNLNAWTPINKLLVPKGVANPWSYERAKDDMTKVFNVIITKDIKQSEEDK